MAVTIKDIARKVGVNPSTVSRVINGTAAISAETKKKIVEAMREMDYHPNSQARSLVNGSTYTIGLVIDAGDGDAFLNTFFIRSVCAIETVTQEKGYNLLITNDRYLKNGNAVHNLIMEQKVDGVILPVSSMTEELVLLLLNNHFPFVVMGEPEKAREGLYWVDTDNTSGGSQAVKHLLQAGYQRPVLFVENRGTVFEKNRMLGFRQGLQEAGIEWEQRFVVESGMNRKTIAKCIEKLLVSKQPADAVICTNNVVACHVLQELKIRGLKVPADMGVVAFDNYPLAEYMEPPLTVVDVDTYRLGEMAALKLFETIRQKKPQEGNTVIPIQMIQRASTRRQGQKEKGEWLQK